MPKARTVKVSVVFLGLFLGSTAAVTHAAVIYVNVAAGGAGTGLTWDDAYTDLQLALAAASNGDQIWVAQGVYKPSVEFDVDGSGGMDPREVTFQIPSGVELYGGFVGGEGGVGDADPAANPTILSGDIDDNDLNGDGNDIAETTADLVGDNAYHVLLTQSVSASTLLNGFHVTAGQAGGFMGGFSPNRDGGGWHNVDDPPADVSSPRIERCRFLGNFADARGGALFIGSFTLGTYEPAIVDCEFSGNEVERSGGAVFLLGDGARIERCVFDNNAATAISPDMSTLPAAGGAIFLLASTAKMTECQFTSNSATGNATGPFEGGGGGAVYASNITSTTDSIGGAFPEFFNCGFYNNSVGGNGGAWGGAATHFSDGGNLRVRYVGCVFSGNTATDDGGAVANFARTIQPPAVLDPIIEPEFTNCTFTGNSAGQEGGAIFFDGSVFDAVEMLNALIENCILFGDSAGVSDPEVFNNANNLVTHSLIEGSGGSGGGWDVGVGTDGGSNIDVDPQFVNAADADGGDNTPGTIDDGLFPAPASPVVEAGNDAAPALAAITMDFAGGTRVVGTVDMGAYEVGDAEPPEITCPGDVVVECDASTDPDNTGTATATDNLDPDPEITFLDDVQDGGCPHEFVITRTWTATDGGGFLTRVIRPSRLSIRRNHPSRVLPTPCVWQIATVSSCLPMEAARVF